MKTLLAGPRDASWVSKPGRGGKFHALYDGGDRGMRSCCDPEIVIDDTRIEPAHGLVPSEKCNRGGCRVEFERACRRET